MRLRLLKHFVLTTVVLLPLSSCLKQGDTTVFIYDPQEVPLITSYLPEELLLMYGEENVHFGYQPPLVDLEFKSQHEFVATNLDSPYGPQPGELSPITYYHKLSHPYFQVADYFGMNTEETQCHRVSPVYLMGSGNDFTVFYYEVLSTAGAPEHAVLMSGTLTDRGIKDFMYGYMIMDYKDSAVPATAYPVNSVFIFKDWDRMAEKCSWFEDSLFVSKNPVRP